ncbi:OadG family protein [Candidatus Sulfurimonas baltica]|uniref:Probable oxaloacetate decarboxylase gamma chain n=1 Tax=Candidatus Sulfurimonas baltica TaxID=2740404 RepID=A0A7S7RNV5_9BACT|nr:OadG family transporter subunit [Candidatus Sulfurimonas baltica]QOY52931.1 OadG family protein [Candidatus Sulfurimonas baltica]
METNLVIEGFKFMGLGMGTVFLFLIIMIFAMGLMSKMVAKFFPEVKVSEKVAAATAVNTQNKNKKIVAAITAAIKHHRG